jgi:hypothetical protein
MWARPVSVSDCYRAGFLSGASACRHTARHTSWSHWYKFLVQVETPRARGRVIVGTHRLCSRGSAAPLPAAASYGIVSERVSPFHAVFIQGSRPGAATPLLMDGFETVFQVSPSRWMTDSDVIQKCYRTGSLSGASACRHAAQTISSLSRRALVGRLLLGLTA